MADRTRRSASPLKSRLPRGFARDPWYADHVVKVLIPRRLRYFQGHAAGHRAIHYAGDGSLGVGLLVTQPAPTMHDLRRAGMTRAQISASGLPYEADYVRMADWVVYAAPNEFTNPYVIDVRAARDARKLARSYDGRARAIFASVDRRWANRLRRRMPFNACARCHKPAEGFLVPKEDWARVGDQWLRTILCPACYEEITGLTIPRSG